MTVVNIHAGGNKNVVLGGVAAVLLVVAGAVFLFSSGEGEAAPDLDPDRMVEMTCSECQAVWEIPHTEYEGLKDGRGDALDRVKCKECGAKKAWQTQNTIAFGNQESDEDDEDPVSQKPENKRPPRVRMGSVMNEK